MTGLLLLSAITIIYYGETQVPAAKFTAHLEDLIPTAPAGWQRIKRSIADTPEIQQAVGELLNYDDAVFYDFISPKNKRLSVYIAYWTPGRMSNRLVASHTPDVCWVGNGWKQEEARTITPKLNAATIQVPSAQERVFSINGTKECVWFWHLVGNQNKDYSTQSAPPWYAPFTDMWEKGINQREEQFFIRISSSSPINTWTHEPTFEQLLKALPW
ncbi:MAG: exosortase-associated EpsI family protein [Verrucomicrobia bacterium]|nr:exosortase-associated EpsI family protein [Verrucomicrobiota bacterium]